MSETRLITVDDGTALAVRVWVGSGPTLLLLHDLGCASVYWLPVIDRLQTLLPDAQLVVPDLRGHGESSCGKETSRKRLAKDVRKLCAALDIAHPVLVGHGWGADIALTADVDPSAIVAINPLLGRREADFEGDVCRPRDMQGASDAQTLEACRIGVMQAKRIRWDRRSAPLLLITAEPADADGEGLAELMDAAEETLLWQDGSRHLPLEAPAGIAALIASWVEETA